MDSRVAAIRFLLYNSRQMKGTDKYNKKEGYSCLNKDFDSLSISKGLKKQLRKDGINTLQELRIQYDLGLLSTSEYDESYHRELRRICKKLGGMDNIVENPSEVEQQQNDDSEANSKMTIGVLWKDISKSRRNFSILVNYYNNYETINLRLFGEHYGISRERVRQIVENGTNKLRGLASCDFADRDALYKIQLAANNQTEVNSLEIGDKFFTDSGIAYLFAAMYPDRYRIIKGRMIHGAWFVKKESNIEDRLMWLIDDLKYGFKPFSFEEIKRRYLIGEKMISALDGVFERDGFITSKHNYDVISKMLSEKRKDDWK
ncbi:hypothetical protein J5868_02645 [Candidatus Saccharibacteria bacterium]|nr:hypothetical protein [Candidatus Saccharibacteria bacterium]